MSVLQGSNILVTGGTGSFGKAFIRYALDNLDPHRLVIFSRDELKQYEGRQLFDDDKRLRWFIGDVRDERRLLRALHNIDYVVHAAALKQVDTGEYNPFEFVQTNVMGSQNVIEACIDAGVKRVVALSTDKASSPINLYGATKLTADKLFISGNHYAAAYDTRFSVVRYGNVMGSRGSVIPFFRKLAEAGQSLPDHRPALHPVLHHAAAGRAVRRGLLRPDGRRRALRAADPVDEDHRPGAGRSHPARRCTTSGCGPARSCTRR